MVYIPKFGTTVEELVCPKCKKKFSECQGCNSADFSGADFNVADCNSADCPSKPKEDSHVH